MAIITEYDDQPTSPSKSKPKLKPEPEPKTSKRKTKPNRPTKTPNPNPFTFWFYFTIIVSIITSIFISLSYFTTPDPKTWFLNLPANLRTHYSSGRIMKVQINPNEPQVNIFTYSNGVKNTENVVFVHGLGCSSFSFKGIVDGLGSMGFFGVVFDLPGSGFSDKVVEREDIRVSGGNDGVFGKVLGIFEEIREKGIFWGFDSLIEHGHLPVYDDDEVEKAKKAKNRVVKEMVEVPLGLGGDEVGRVLEQVVEGLGLAPFHLVIHDSGLAMVANWIVENSGLVRSVTVLDSLPREVALPLGVFDVRGVREVVLGVNFVFRKLIESCCSRGGGGESVEGERVLLKGKGAKEAIVGMWKKLNYSLELSEWVSMEGMRGMPMQVLWSGSWSDEWSEEGRRVAEMVSQGKLVRHSGGRWPQDDTSSEIAENIFSFVSSLPKTEKIAEYDESLSEHIQKNLDEAKAGGQHRDEHAHDHDAQAGYIGAYGLGEGQGHGHGWGM